MNRFTLAAVKLVILVALVLTASPSTAQTYPTECKPAGAYSCAAYRATDFRYESKACTFTPYFPTEYEAAEYAKPTMGGSDPGCPVTTWEWSRWAQDEKSNCSGDACTPPDATFSICYPGTGAGPYPRFEAGYDILNYSIYTQKVYRGPTCDLRSTDWGLVRRDRSVECPEGRWSGATGSHCYRQDTRLDVGKNLGCPKTDQGQCTVGNPINIGSGNKYQVETDFTGTGPNPLQFRRFYNSLAGRTNGLNKLYRFSGANHALPVRASIDPDQASGVRVMATDSIGVNWRHTYHRALVEYKTPNIRSVSMYRQDGRVLIFNEYSGSWHADADVNLVLTELTNAGTTTGWTVVTPGDDTETYSAEGKLLSIVDRAGNPLTLAYDSVGRLETVTDAHGRSLTFGYDSVPQVGTEWYEDTTLVNQIKTMTDPLGNVFAYDYGADGTLIKVTNPDLTFRELGYNNAQGWYPYALTSIKDENGDQYATYDYQGGGLASLSYHGVGADIVGRVDVTYSFPGSAQYYDVNGANVVRASGSAEQRSHSMTPANKLGVAKMQSATYGTTSEARTYDAAGNVQTHTDKNGVVLYREYNSRNLETLRREANGTPLQRETTTTWHPTYRLPDAITEPNRITDYDYYPNGDLQTVTITSRNISGTEDLSTDGNRTRISNYTYNTHGQVTSIDGPRVDVSDVTTLNYYDEPACPTGNGECGQLEYIINAEGQRTDFNEYYADGRLKKMTDASGLVTEYEYDSRRELTKTTLSDGLTSRITLYTYDAAGQLDLVMFPNGLILDYDWTTAHLLDTVTDNFGNKIDYDYDAHGNQKEELRVDPNNVIRRAVATTFDEFDFVDTVTNGSLVSGNAISTNYDFDPLGNLKKLTDADAKETNFSVDELNRTYKVTDALLNDTDYALDDMDNTSLVTAANDAVTSIEYDGLGNLDKESSADRGLIDLDYDDAGNGKTRLDARGKQLSYSYDSLNRLTKITLDDGITEILYEYDDVPSNAVGRLHRITDSSGSTSWTYTKFGDVKTKTHTIGSINLVTVYDYHPDGRLNTITLPSSKVVTIGYNVFQPNSISVDSTPVLSGATYDPFGPVNGWLWGNGTSNIRSYDTRGFMDSQTLLTDSRVLGYDSVGRLNSLDDGRPISEIDYTELVPVTGSFDVTVLPYSNQVDTVAGPVAKDYDYDAAGNVTTDGIHSYSYDDRGRLITVDSGTVATYTYNGQGQRVKKVVNSATTLFAYDEQGRLIGEYNQSGTPIKEHIWFNELPVAVLEGANIYYVHADHLGTPRVISNGNTAIWEWQSSPFGLGVPDNDPDGDLTTFEYNRRFPGQYFDAETGLHYNYYRTYDPSTGRYLESDPIGLIGGLNTYGYVSGDPIGSVDSFGLDEDTRNPWNVYQEMNRGRSSTENSRYYRQYRLGEMAKKRRYKKRRGFSPWETTVSEGCFFGPRYSYQWSCKNPLWTPPGPSSCRSSDYESERTTVFRSHPGSPAGECSFVKSIYEDFGWYCPDRVEIVEYPRQLLWEATK